MEAGAVNPGYSHTFQNHGTPAQMLCCLCGTPILSNPSNMCINCVRSQVDITEGLQKQVTVLWCKECNRYLQPPKHWVRAELESKELLTFCIKRLKGLQKVKLVDASFIWTEPHSRRLKVKLTIQREVFNGAILQQAFVVEYIVENHMCPDCNRMNANPNSWKACVQVRQHVPHKRTFFFLEQLIIKHQADEHCVKINDIHEGVDFFFNNRAHASKFIDFLQAVVPIKFRHDKQLVSHDIHTSSYNYKYTFSVEIAPICKDDMVCLPPKVAQNFGNIGPVLLCTRISSALHLVDPTNLRTAVLDAAAFWRQAFGSMMTSRALVEYMVLDIEPVHSGGHQQQQQGGGGKFQLADVQVARLSDFGRNDQVYFARTHLGHVLHPGDTAMGYDMANANLVGLDLEKYLNKGGQLPDVVLVRKSYEEKRKKKKSKGASRPWKLKQLAMEVDGRTRNDEQEEADRERFLDELEEDADMRSRINVYKNPAVSSNPTAGPKSMDDSDDEDDDVPEIPLEELLDELAALDIDEGDEEDEDEHMMD